MEKEWDETKYGTQICPKCGREYTKLYRFCPQCGYNARKSIFIILSLTLAIVVMMALEGFVAVKAATFEKRLENMEEKMEQGFSTLATLPKTEEQEDYDITKLQYFADHLIGPDTSLESLGEDYLIFAMQEGCPACEASFEYVYLFLYYGYPDQVPMFYITPESSEDIFYNELSCTDTPTLYRMNGNTVVDKAVGTDGVFELLDQIVSEVKDEKE